MGVIQIPAIPQINTETSVFCMCVPVAFEQCLSNFNVSAGLSVIDSFRASNANGFFFGFHKLSTRLFRREF